MKYAMSVAGNQEEARDAVQEAYLRYFIQRRYGRQIDNPPGWLCQVLRNYLLDRFKGAARKLEVASASIEDVPDKSQNPERTLQGREVAAEIAAVLTGRELQCLRLHAAGLCYEEISAAMDVRLGTVGAVLSRIHRKLRLSRDAWMARGLTDAVCTFLAEGQA
jgi:RNA polymerase sigma-70 factor (ECF subfamily)